MRYAAAVLAGLVLLLAVPLHPATQQFREVRIQAGLMDYDGNARVAHCTKGVHMKTSEGTVDSSEAVITLDQANRVIRIEAKGNVKSDLTVEAKDAKTGEVKRRLVNSTSDEGIYTPGDQRLVLVGNVKGFAQEVGTQNKLDLTGKKATILLRDARYIVEEADATFTEEVKEEPAKPKAENK